jgi:mannose-6-phosphate isomerase-like protein (cupin superfamily)
MGRIDKPWGYEEQVLMTQVDVGDQVGMLGIRRLVIDADEMTSYAYHDKQADILYLEEGNVVIRHEEDMKDLEEENAIVIRSGENHQIQNIDDSVAKVLEISFPYIPDDLTRVEDPYEDEREEEDEENSE